MEKHGTTSQPVAGWYKDSILKLISRGLVLDAVDGTEILSKAKDTFAYIDSDFINWGVDEEGPATKEISVAVYEIVKDATFSQIFNSLSNDPNGLCLTQAQIKKFVRKYRNWLRTDGYATFFLFKSHSQFFVADVGLGFDGRLRVFVIRLGDSGVWFAGGHHRLVVPRVFVIRLGDSGVWFAGGHHRLVVPQLA